ncbi:hypothetical protein D3C75_672480 [compost metagenome]
MTGDGDLPRHILEQGRDFTDHRPELGLQEGGSRRERRLLADANDDLLTQRLYLYGPVLDLGLHLLGQRLGQFVGLRLRLLGLLGGVATALLTLGLVMPPRLIRIPGLKIQLGLGHVYGLLHDGVDGRRFGPAGAKLLGDDRGPLGNILHLQDVLHPERLLHGAGDLLELLHIHLRKGEQQHEEAHQQGHEIGEGTHVTRQAGRRTLALCHGAS